MNFLNFFQMKENPFGETPNTRFFYPSLQHIEALEKIEHALNANKSFTLLLGQVGCGKTLLSRVLQTRFGSQINSALVLIPPMEQKALLHSICKDFGIVSDMDYTLEILADWLWENALLGKSNILIIDEAQKLPDDCLELIRTLTNLETENRKLLQVVLVGQNELESKLEKPELQQLSQRIYLKARLIPFQSYNDTQEYVRFRLDKSGGTNFVQFEKSALVEIHRRSKGIPRLINKLCEQVLEAAAQNKIRSIDIKLVQRIDQSFRPREKRNKLWSLFG